MVRTASPAESARGRLRSQAIPPRRPRRGTLGCADSLVPTIVNAARLSRSGFVCCVGDHTHDVSLQHPRCKPIGAATIVPDDRWQHFLRALDRTPAGSAPTLAAALTYTSAIPVAYRRLVICRGADHGAVVALLDHRARGPYDSDRSWIQVPAWPGGGGGGGAV